MRDSTGDAKMTFTKNTFIRWTGTDAEGTFSHVGRVVSATDSFVVLATEIGEMTIDQTNGSFDTVTAPSKFKATPTKKTTVTSTLKPGSVKQSVFELLKGKTVSRKEAIELIVKAGLSSPAGASTHYNAVKNMI